MGAHFKLLPREATPWEKLNSDVNDDWANLADEYARIPDLWTLPTVAFQPFRIWELGLGSIQPYLPNIFELLSKGVKWQRIRGTPAAVDAALSWIGYTAAIEEEPTRRRLWNRFQLHLDRVRDDDSPDLTKIADLAAQSAPARSIFWRGFAGYDVRACEASYQRASECLASDHSGVRLPGIYGSKVVNVMTHWSFGRRYDNTVPFTQADLEALGAWIAPVGESDVWGGADYAWDGADFAWDIPGAAARLKSMADVVVPQPAYVQFKTAGGATIGYALATVHAVSQAVRGPYPLGGTSYVVNSATPTAIVVIASSDFGDAAGQSAASTQILFGATRAPGVKPGRNWLAPEDFSGGVAVAPRAVSIPFGLTVREQVRYILRF